MPKASTCASVSAGMGCSRGASTRAGREKLSRGTIYANLTVDRKGVQPTAKVNEPVLGAILSTLKSLSGKVEAAPASLDGILSLRGVIEIAEEDEARKTTARRR